MLKALAISLFTAGLILVGAPAFAVADDATPHAQVLYPLHTRHDGQIRIVIQGPSNTRGLRSFAREADAQLSGVTIYERGLCKNHPHAECVRVHFKHYGAKKGWYAQTLFYDPTREIQVNLDIPNDHPHAVMVHEFGHVLGLEHHVDEGICGGTANVIHLSQGERDALNAAYPITRGGLD